MQTTTLGKSTLAVTRIGLGLAALGRPGYVNLGHQQDLPNTDVEAMRQHSHQMLDAAWDAGIRYFDVARSYGKAEDFLDSWLNEQGLLPTEIAIGSKWGYTYTADWQVDADVHEVKEHSLAVLDRQMEETRQFLGSYLDLYQIHSATFESGVLENTAVLTRLAELKDDGLLIGLSLSGADQSAVLDAALAIQVDGVTLFDAVQATWNLLEPSVGGALQAAHDAGWGVIVKEGVANGRLTPRNDALPAVVHQQAERLHTSIDALALAAALNQPFVDVVLSGATTLEQLQSNLGALTVAWDAEAADTLAQLAEPVAEYWHIRRNLTWN